MPCHRPSIKKVYWERDGEGVEAEKEGEKDRMGREREKERVSKFG